MVVTRSQTDEMERREPPYTNDPQQIPTPSAAQPARHVMAATASRERVASLARSQRSTRSITSVTTRLRTAELEAEEKLAAIRREELKIETELVKKRLALQLEIIHDDAEVQVYNPNVSTELHTHPSTSRGEPAVNQEQRATTKVNNRPQPTLNIDERLVTALENMTHSRPPPRQAAELPIFTGAITEWLPFKAAMRDSTQIYKYSDTENLIRLRTVVRGEARDAVATLLYSATDPEVIMKALERCFGRPEALMDSAMEDIKKLPRIGTTTTDINMFAVRVQNVIYALKCMNNPYYLHNPLLAREIVVKLSPWMRSKWNEYAESFNDLTDEPKLVTLSRFLNQEADLTLKHSYTTVPTRISKEPPKQAPVIPTKRKQVFATTVDIEPEQRCPNCEQNHVLTRCPGYKTMNVNQRWNLVREKGMFFRCVDKKHRRTKCKESPCGVKSCRRPHHHTLHEERPVPSDTNVTHKLLTTADEAKVTNITSHNHREVLLKVCPVTVIGPRGKVETYALLDEGSTISLIDEEMATKIGTEGLSRPLQLRGVNGMSRREEGSRLVRVRLRGKADGTDYELQARTVQGLSLHKQTIPRAMLQHHHLRDLNKNQVCYKSARPTILVGSDNWELIVSRELRVGELNQPAASRTQLGWVVHGTAPHAIVKDDEDVLHVYTPTYRTYVNNDVLHELVEAHFKIDALGVSSISKTSDADQRAMKIFETTVKKIEGRYEVGLPWRYDNVTMPPSYNSALRRLRSIEKKMDLSACFSTEYSAQIKNLLEKGYATPCEGSEKHSAVSWYLPHFSVRNPNKPGKVRLVFDAAARCNRVSLNDKLLQGPDLLQSLLGIMFRFRERPIAVTADIAEMFLQVKIRPEDQPAQLLLWRGADRTSPPKHYKMTSMIFGASSSPFLAHSVRNKNARDHEDTHPYAFKAITLSHYMDDLVDSYNTKEEALQTIAEVREVHAVAGFTLRGWSANDDEVLVEVPSELRAQVPNQLGGRHLDNKILGIYWNAATDEIGFNTIMHRVPDDVRTSKRPPKKP